MIKKIAFLLMTLAVVVSSCNNYETYGDKKEKERNAISKFISDHNITVISEDQFNQQGSKNEYVKFDRNGVYMQIVRQGCGSDLADGGQATLVCRYAETNIFADTIQSYNNTPAYAATPDRMFISRATSVYSAQFLDGMMMNTYGATVPAGWLVPMPYIKIGHPTSETEECSRVRLIVPHTQGHAYSSSNVIPYFYEITYEREV